MNCDDPEFGKERLQARCRGNLAGGKRGGANGALAARFLRVCRGLQAAEKKGGGNALHCQPIFGPIFGGVRWWPVVVCGGGWVKLPGFLWVAVWVSFF